MANSIKDVAVSFLRLAASGKVREAYSQFVGAGERRPVEPGDGGGWRPCGSTQRSPLR